MDQNAQRIFCLTGIDGCGKSTQTRLLQEWLENEGAIEFSTFGVWDITRSPRYQGHAFISDKAAIHQYLGRLHGGARALFIFHALFEALAMNAGKPFLGADGYWYKYAFTEHLHGENLTWLEKVAAGFPRPRLVLFLDLAPELAWKRKEAFTPYECGFKEPNEANFIEFQTKLRNLFVQKAAQEGWAVLPADQPPETVANEIRKLIAQDGEIFSRR